MALVDDGQDLRWIHPAAKAHELVNADFPVNHRHRCLGDVIPWEVFEDAPAMAAEDEARMTQGHWTVSLLRLEWSGAIGPRFMRRIEGRKGVAEVLYEFPKRDDRVQNEIDRESSWPHRWFPPERYAEPSRP